MPKTAKKAKKSPKKIVKPSKPVKKVSKPAKTAKKVVKPARSAKRPAKEIKKPKSKKRSIKDLEKELGRKVGKSKKVTKPSKPAKLSRSETLRQAEEKASRKSASRLRKASKSMISPVDDLRQKLLSESESKAITAVKDAIKARLQKIVNFTKQVDDLSYSNKLAGAIMEATGVDPRLNTISFTSGVTRKQSTKQRLQKVDEEVVSHVGNNPYTGKPVVAADEKVTDKIPAKGYVASETRNVLVRAGAKSVFTSAFDFTKHMFHGKERAIVSFASVGSVQETTYVNEKGKREHGYYGFILQNDSLGESGNWQKMIDTLASKTNMRLIPQIKPKHVFSSVRLRMFTTGREFGFFKKNSTYAFLARVENDVVYGCYIAHVPSRTDSLTGDKYPGGFIIGYWGGIGVTVSEMKTLTEGRFDEHFESENPDPKMTNFIGHSLMTQFYNSKNRGLQVSIADLSVTRDFGSDKDAEDFIGKSESGAIIYVPNVDQRDKFDDWVEERMLPEELSDEDYVLGTNLTEQEYFAGRIVYTDMKNKIMFYYTKGGDLRKFDFSSSSKLNLRDKAELTKEKATDPQFIKENRDTQSFYGASFFFTEKDYRVVVDSTAAKNTFDELMKFKFQGYRDDSQGMQQSAENYGERMVLVTIEGLRESYQGDKEFYEVIEQYYEELRLGAAYFYSQGHRDVIPLEDSNSGESGRFSEAALRRAPTIGMMLSIAKKSYDEWPHENDLRAKAKEQLQKMTKPSREDLDAVIGCFDGLTKDKNGNYPKLMPQQVESLAVMRNTNTAALDVDMGGGKTIIACLDMVRLIREGITTEDGERVACRPLVVMPGSKLVRNYIDDVKKFFGTNLNIFVLETDQTIKNAVSNSDLVDRMRNAPANTIFVTTYSWLTSGNPYDITLNTEYDKSGNLKLVTKKMFPRVEMLKQVPITAVYLDESHKIKNKSSSQNKAAVALSGVPVKRLLTGTMVSKDATDIHQQMRFLDSTLIGSEARFIAQYGAGDETGPDGKVKKAKRGDLRPGAEKEAREELRSNGVLQLRRSSWLPLLPEKDEKFLFVDMSQEHAAVYTAMLMKLVATPLKALELGLIDEKQYAFLIKLQGALGMDSDEDSDAEVLGGRAGSLLGDDESSESDSESDADDDGKMKGRTAQRQAMQNVQQNMAVMMAAMQDFLTAPELLDPRTFDNDPNVMEALRNAGLVDEGGNMIGFSVGPKDTLITNIIRDHFSKTGGRYVKRSEQERRFGNDKSRYAGKVIIFHNNINAATHFYNTLKKAGIPGVGMYQADKNLHKESDAHLAAFKDPENDSISILCAAEGAILLGQNMQSANVVIRCSTPWTTGDYDQSIARAFRNGQDLKVVAYNIQVNRSFEVLKLVKLFVRESSNRKLNSNFDVPFEISKSFAECTLENHRDYATEDVLHNFPVNRYSNPKRPNAGMYESNADLFAELHDEIWKQEKLAAFGPDEKRARAKDPAYLNDPNNHCEAARYHKLGLDTMTEMATGEDKIQPKDLAVTPKNSKGEYAQHGFLSTEGLDALFNGFVAPEDRGHLKKLRYQEVRKVVRNADPGNALRAAIEESFDSIVEAKPSYQKMYGKRRDEIIEELYKDFTNDEGKRSKDFGLFGYVGLHEGFIRGIYNLVVSRYRGIGLVELELGKNADLKMNVKRAVDNAKRMSGTITSFRKVNGDPEDEYTDVDEEAEDLQVEDEDSENIDEEDNDQAEEDLEDIEQNDELVRDVLVVGLSKYFSDLADSATDDDAQLMLFAPISSANPLAKKLPRFHLPSGKSFQKRVRYVYTRNPITSSVQIKHVLAKIEANGGVIEAKDEDGYYDLLNSQILRTLLSSKAPSTKNAESEHSVNKLFRSKEHQVTSKVAGKKKQNIDCGFLVLDGRITVTAFPDGDKQNFNPNEEAILRASGFKRVEYMVVMYKVNEPQKKKLHRDLIALATKFNGEGVEFYNEEKFQRHVRVFTKTPVDYSAERE